MSKPEESITPLGNGLFRITRSDGSQAVAYGAADGVRIWVFLEGVTHVVEPSRRRSAGQDAAPLAAPMPATVTQIHVAVGQAVAAADLLVTLEAMKMELPIRATIDGTVTAINCGLGELVQPGRPLVELREIQGRGRAKARATNDEANRERKPNAEPGTEPRTPNRTPNVEREHELRSEKREE